MFLLAIACSTAPDTQSQAPVFTDTEAYVEREMLVAIRDNGDGIATMEVQEKYGAVLMEDMAGLGVAHLLLPDQAEVRDVRTLMEQDRNLDFAEPNYLTRASASAPNDPYADYQWNLDMVGAYEAWDISDGSGTLVAVLDTGVRAGGPDGITTLLGGYDAYYNDNDPSDFDGHGTFVAGTIAQRTNNGRGVAGLAPGAAILPVKVLSDQGFGDVRALANGIVYATDQGADVINMSLGSPTSSQTEYRAVQYAYDRDVVLVAASGNEFARSVSYPAAYPEVIAVGAVRASGTRSPYSNTGNGLEIVAPGGDLNRDDNGDGYADGVLQETVQNGQFTYVFWEGTSMAAPHVAAAAAMLKSAGINDPEEVREVLALSARDGGSAGYDTSYGYGILDVEAALALVQDNTLPDQVAPEPEKEEPTPEVDTTAPSISNIDGIVDGGSFTLMWTTNELATSGIEFEDYGLYDTQVYTTSHSMRFNGNPGDTYVFKFVSVDESGNRGETDWYQIRL